MTKLKEVIDDQGRKHSWIVKKLGVSHQTVSSWAHGKATPTDKHKRELSKLLGMSVQELFYDE